jgi:glycogen phosphorylase
VIPTFYDRDIDGLPRRWIKMMMNSISTWLGGSARIAW